MIWGADFSSQQQTAIQVIQPTDEWGWLAWAIPGVIVPIILFVLSKRK
jgi:hypothetical protein